MNYLHTPTETKSIAFFMPSFGGGGAERVLIDLANEFASRGFKVHMVIANSCGPYRTQMSNSVDLINLRCSRVLLCLMPLIFYLRKERPDVMLSAQSHCNVIALLAKRLSGVKTRLVVSEHSVISRLLRLESNRLRTLLSALMRWTYPWANGVVAVSRGAADDLATTIHYPLQNIKVIYNPINLPKIQLMSNEFFDHPWFVDDAPLVILGVGRLSIEKDFDTLIRAFAELRAKCSTRLVILGEGELRPRLKILINELKLSADIEMPGFVQNPYVYMRHGALLVLSSSFEGFGNVLVEAMCCGMKVLSTFSKGCGPIEILENGKWGRLVPEGDVNAMCNAMLDALHECTSPNVVDRAREFSLDKATEDYRKILFEE